MNDSTGEVRLTLIVPCYNERGTLETTIPPLYRALTDSIEGSEMVLVDNGSTDGTGELIDRMAGANSQMRVAVVPENRGYGLGVLTGYTVARGRCIGHIPADGPVTPEDVVMLANRALDEGAGAMVTAVRRHRQETIARKLVSRTYNSVFFVLFGRYTQDINGTPKFVHAEDLARMRLSSLDYFLEAEMMIKARRLDMRTVPVEVMSQARPGGESKVSAGLLMACTEFVVNLLKARFSTLPDAEYVSDGESESTASRRSSLPD